MSTPNDIEAKKDASGHEHADDGKFGKGGGGGTKHDDKGEKKDAEKKGEEKKGEEKKGEEKKGDAKDKDAGDKKGEEKGKDAGDKKGDAKGTATGSVHDSPKSLKERAAGLLAKVKGIGGKAVGAAKAAAQKAQELAYHATWAYAKGGVFADDVLETVHDHFKICNDRGMNEQIAQHLGIPMNTAVQNAIIKVGAFAICKVKGLIASRLGRSKSAGGTGLNAAGLSVGKRAKLAAEIAAAILREMGVKKAKLPTAGDLEDTIRKKGRADANGKPGLEPAALGRGADRTAGRRGRVAADDEALTDLGELWVCPGVAAAINPEPADGQKLPSFEGVAYTGVPMRPEGWWRQVIIDLDGVKVPSQHRPSLRQHDPMRVVGHTTEVTVSPAGIAVKGVFSGDDGPDARQVLDLAAKGFRWQLSIGANPVRMEELEAGKEAEVNGRTVVGPLTISRETELGEVSFVPLGADQNTSVAISASQGRRSMNWKNALKQARADGLLLAGMNYSDESIDQMDEKEAKAALKKCMAAADDEDLDADDSELEEADEDEDVDADEDEDVDADDEEEEETAKASRRTRLNAAGGGKKIKASAGKKAGWRFEAKARKQIMANRKAEAAEQRRVSAIKALGQQYTGANRVQVGGKEVDLIAHAIEAGWTPARVELVMLKASRPAAGVGAGPLVYSTSSPQVSEAVIEAGILHSLRHSFRLNDDSFYQDPSPSGGTMRRVPEAMQREVQGDIRARYTDQVQQAAHSLWRGRLTLHEVLDTALNAAGGTNARRDMKSEPGIRAMMAEWDATSKQSIRAGGAGSIDVSNILANVLNKFALQGYLYVEQAWREIAGVRPVPDFKPTKSINLLGDVMYKQVGSTGELTSADLGDQAFSNQAAPFGRILTIPWTHIVNDDLSMFSGVPVKIGQGAGLALNDYFWALVASLVSGSAVGIIPSTANLNGDDGTSFFRTTSDTTTKNKKYKKNKITGGTTALSSAALQTAKAVFDNQIDPNGNPLGFDGAMPVLLFGPSNWQTAVELMMAPAIVYGGASASRQPNVNVWAGMMKPVMSRYVENASYVNTTTGWALVANPVALPFIEVAFLNGVDTPAVLQAGPDYQFDRLGISIRGTMPFGVTQQNFRGIVYSAGA